jgi:hypothetical protein
MPFAVGTICSRRGPRMQSPQAPRCMFNDKSTILVRYADNHRKEKTKNRTDYMADVQHS